jgi:exopolysaccharide biosynthesis polyprenyl glycosylphosphotransferase
MSKRVPARVEGGILDARAPFAGVLDQRPLRAVTGAPGHQRPQHPAADPIPIDLDAPPDVLSAATTVGPQMRVAQRDVIDLDATWRVAPSAARVHHERRSPALRADTATRRDPFLGGESDDLDLPSTPRRDTGGEPAGGLRRTLVLCDLMAVAVLWSAIITLARDAALGGGLAAAAVQSALATGVTLIALHQLRLYQGRVCGDRRVTRRRLAVAAVVAPVLFATGRALLQYEIVGPMVAASIAAPWVGLVLVREMFEQWLRASRLRGRHVRPIVLAGSADEVRQIAHLLDAHPEAGFRPVGWIGRRRHDDRGRAGVDRGAAGVADELDRIDHLGDGPEVVRETCRSGATGLLVGPSAAAWPSFPKVARQLQDEGLHVQMWSGLWGVSSRRLRPMQLAHEPFFYLERAGSLSRTPWLKRGLDVVVASAVLVLASPVLAVAALLIKRHDGGPVLFRQKRVGLHGELFELHKLRTMGVDAEVHLDRLRADNERSGPLFKLASDPRVTPIGRVLRATSIDELPQLLDVLAGRLSLVGPRPALPAEVAEFDRALLDRHGVLPGLTGLWQAEARHNPSFDAYRHLDLFYVENWTVILDVLILFATVRTVLTDTVRAGSSFLERARRRRHDR